MPGKVDEDLCDHSGSDGNFVSGLITAGHALNTLAKPEFILKTSPDPGDSVFQSEGNECTRSADHLCGLFYRTIRILFNRCALFFSSEMKTVHSLKWFSDHSLSRSNGTISEWRKIITLYVYRFNRFAWLLYDDVKFLTYSQSGTKELSFFVSSPVISCIARVWFNPVKEKLCIGEYCRKTWRIKYVEYGMRNLWIGISSLHRNSWGVNRNEGYINECDMKC